ncbi:hypothetical protein O7606_13295 [Micromonospora sp. WMMD882]|uniref:hypothetical protein n=1 Tax=Micromonospora sp. WMMD882 TaxID=3015151 RepID=UPI00248CB1AD|nr:hypothetical protein [Micromonospora sp. WMMD882]WBB77275.1 hypothetical protein O7606_13295 [Micromonospora sp. WMMD882]
MVLRVGDPGMRPSGRHVAVGVAAALLVTALAGCVHARPAGPAGPPPGSRGDTSAPGAATPLSGAALDLAVRAGPYWDDERLLQRAERELTRRCMAARGFGQPTPGEGGGTAGDDDPWQPNLAVRRQWGYGLGVSPPAPDGDYPPGLPPARRDDYVRALTGDPGRRAVLRLAGGLEFTIGVTGCVAESRTELYGDILDAARVFYVPQEIHNTLRRQIAESAAVRVTETSWKNCMNGRGYAYESMLEARADAHRKRASVVDVHVARQAEIRIAVADGECALAAGLPDAVDREGRRHATALPAGQRADLDRAAHLRSAATRRARGVVGGGGPG